MIVLIGTAILWYCLRGLAHVWAPARDLVTRLSPYTRALHAWVLSAPATFTYVAIFIATTVLQRTAPPRLIEILTRLQSTNLVNLRTTPVAVFIDSAFWVAYGGSWLLGYVAVFATVVAWAERRYGPPRMILVGIAGHVLGTLLTVPVIKYMIATGLESHSLARVTDVGVSYVMLGGCGGALVLLRGRRLLVGALVLGAVTVLPVLIRQSIWDVGHLMATLSGVVVGYLLLLVAPPRSPSQLPQDVGGRGVGGARVAGAGPQ